MEGQICTQESPILSNNILPEFCNFNSAFTWNKPSGGTNATILNNVSTTKSYYGVGCVQLNFSANGEVQFNAGDSSMQKVINTSGNYILSFAFKKDDDTADINFRVEVLVNDVPTYEISQNLYFSSGFTDGQWNCYFQSFPLNYGDVIDFNFYAQCDSVGTNLYFDRMKLELDDRGIGFPTIYTEAPLTIYEEENILTVGEIAGNSSLEVTASLIGASITDSSKRYVMMSYPSELIDLGLVVSVPVVYANNVVKFIIHNHSGSPITPTEDGVYNFKLIR